MITFSDSLPDSARVWINPTNRGLTPEEQKAVLEALSDFIATWSSHGRKVVAEAVIAADRFVITAGHVPGGDVSGCGIDASVHALQSIAQTLEFGWAPALDVFFKLDDKVAQTDRGTFSKLASNGAVTPDTIVYDTSLTTLGDLRRQGFELPARQSWHGRVFRFVTEAV
ncbi:MAG TPA: hypothetical protein VIL33_01385 [Rhodothermia bacterium]